MTATFTYAPSYGSPKNSAPRVLSATFGDGYQQDLVDGINADLKSWDLTFTNRSSADADAIEAFLSLNLGQAFNWTPPGFPTSTTATAEPFGTGDGSTLAFTLKKNGAAVRNITASPTILRSDWQGNQQLYATARTNLIRQTQAIYLGPWSTSSGGTGVAPVITASYTTAPDGTATACRLQLNKGAGSTSVDRSALFQGVLGVTSGLSCGVSVWLKTNDGSTITVKYEWGSTSNGQMLTVTPLWQRFTMVKTAGATNDTLYLYLRGDFGTSNSADLAAWGFQVEAGGIVTSYIPTTTSAVTVTDYTVNLTTGLVTLAVAPLTAAALTWTGAFTPTYLFKCSVWKRTPVDYGADTVTATFKQVLG